MKKRVKRYFKHIFVTLFLSILLGISLLVYLNGTLNYNQNSLRYNLEEEGPYVFYTNDSILNVQYVKGNKNEGFYVDKKQYNKNEIIDLTCFFPLDASKFNFKLYTTFKTPKAIYSDDQKVLAISDIESSYKAFRNFLINNNVIDEHLNWTFGSGHLVLVGDFVDRGFSTTQVLWFIYKLEQEAKDKGGNVHFILGNHELKNMQGQYKSSEQKYYAVASILGKQQYDLYSQNSVLGKWMSSKNTIELINGTLFTHGGIHPEIADLNLSLGDLNRINKQNYYQRYFPKPNKTVEDVVLSTKKGISWYRGYFNDDLSQEEVDKGVLKFDANAIVVGHTLQSKVTKLYNGRVYGIDVKHSKDYMSMFPNKKSEGLLIKEGEFYRAFSTGKLEKL